METNLLLFTILLLSIVCNVVLAYTIRKKQNQNKKLSIQLQKLKDLSTKFRDMVIQREDVFYKNLHNISVSFVKDVSESYLIYFDGDVGRVVSYVGGKNRATIIDKKITKTELPYSASRVYVVNGSELKHIDFGPSQDKGIDSNDSKVLISDIHIGGELKAKLLIERQEPFVDEEIDMIKSLSGFFTSFIATHNYVSNQGRFEKDMILTMIRILEYHDTYTKGHSKNVATIASLIAEKLGLNDELIRKTYWAALVHDVGKIVVPSSILNKESKLTIEEFEVIKKHPVYGHDFLSTSPELRDLARYVFHHHERWDGKGYPAGISGEEIPLISRIIMVADSWDAMRSDRPYRKGLSKEKATEEILKHSGAQFDPNIAKVFIKMLTDGEIQ
ncbi:MAG TPA: HD-GYP domain-containing protein [Fervidobacterium sp.]|nr:HD-GYP domain-containing protein [Fervidobacterium sp.]HOH52703.1 HD-GYP domain-containing protein [Fervidobacterium sp.]HPC25380.1 HD-GYP domain-containing protein [Fervidobacterium sp.]